MIESKQILKQIIPCTKDKYIEIEPTTDLNGIKIMLVRNDSGNLLKSIIGVITPKNAKEVSVTFLSVLHKVKFTVNNESSASPVHPKVENPFNNNSDEETVKFNLTNASFETLLVQKENVSLLTVFYIAENTIRPVINYEIKISKESESIIQKPLGSVYSSFPCREVELLSNKFTV